MLRQCTGPADNAALIEVLSQAHTRGVVLAAISQCPEGRVDFATYAAGSQLAACGVISGGGMTREAALAKLFALLARAWTQQRSKPCSAKTCAES